MVQGVGQYRVIRIRIFHEDVLAVAIHTDQMRRPESGMAFSHELPTDQ